MFLLFNGSQNISSGERNNRVSLERMYGLLKMQGHSRSGGERNYSTCCSIPLSPGQTLQNLDWILSLLPEDCQVKMEEEMDRKESEKENAW
jgi:hypothetical protein